MSPKILMTRSKKCEEFVIGTQEEFSRDVLFHIWSVVMDIFVSVCALVFVCLKRFLYKNRKTLILPPGALF